jgi:MmgE/PrpD N-terminal domain
VTATDEILALAASAAGHGGARGDDGRPASAGVTEADVAAFRALAAGGEDSAVVRALLAIRPAAALTAPPTALTAAPSALSSGDPSWTAWLTAASATASELAAGSGATGTGDAVAAGEPSAGPDEPAARAWPPTWCAVFGAAVALTDPPPGAPLAISVAVAVTAGLRAAAIVESGLDDWGGWSGGSVAAVIGAGVAAGLLLGLDGPRLRAAIGICATQAAGLRAAEGTDAFPLQVGKAAFNGVEAALLARAGFTAPAEPLEGRRGLFALFGS